MGIFRRIHDLFSLMRQARRQGGKSIARQILEASSLKLSARLGLSEYYDCRLFEHDSEMRSLRSFGGYRVENSLDHYLNCREGRMLATDKLYFHAVLEQSSVPTAEILAIYAEGGAYACWKNRLADQNSLRSFLANLGAAVYVKPVRGGKGEDVLGVQHFDTATDMLHLINGKTRPLADLLRIAGSPRQRGLIIQRCLESDPDLLGHVGVCTARLAVIWVAEQPQLHRATLRIPRAGNMVDNFSEGRRGNLLAAIDAQTGRIIRVVHGMGLGQEDVSNHPDTGRRLVGRSLPAWESTISTCMEAASLFPDLKFQHWDVAITAEGPVFLEVNVQGSLDLHQVAHARGMLDGDLLTAWRDCIAGQRIHAHAALNY